MGMNMNTKLVVTVELDYKISLWQAIKLRIAGKNYTPFAESVLQEIRKELNEVEQILDKNKTETQ